MKECASSTDYVRIAEAMKTSYTERRTLKANHEYLGRAGTHRATRGRNAYGVEEGMETHENDPLTAPAYVAAGPER
eukprot:3593788-Lingulodinium_polyedra.AAC.1